MPEDKHTRFAESMPCEQHCRKEVGSTAVQGRGLSFFKGLAPLDIVDKSSIAGSLGAEDSTAALRTLLYLVCNRSFYQLHCRIVRVQFHAEFCLAVQSAVPEIDEQVRCHHCQIQQVYD